MESYYYNRLNKIQQRVYQQMKAGIESISECFDVIRLETAELNDIFHKLRLDEPSIFYVSTFKYSFYEDSNLVKFKPEYMFEKKKIKEHQEALKARVAKLARSVSDKTELEKEQFIHDFMCENVTYDKLKKQYSHEIIGPLTQGVGVCEGIAKSVKVLCDALDIPCIVVLCHNNPEKGIKYRHAWNEVKIGGIWYHLDATFDNTLSKNEIRYDYYNLDDKNMYRDHQPVVYEVPACTESEHSYYRVKKMSFTKIEDVEKRSIQAIKKKKVLTFHWRGGYLTREMLETILNTIAKTAKSKQKYSIISLNWAQAVISVKFTDEEVNDIVNMEDAYEEENATKN